MRRGLLSFLALIAGLVGCDDGREGCDNPSCYATCVADGFVGGACSPGECRCVPLPDGGAPADGDSDADSDAPVDGDLDSPDGDVEGDGDGDGTGCGDGACGEDETAASCPEDCPELCGDGLCTHDEDPLTCPADCPAECGDGLCSHDENALFCPEDCPAECGDGLCTEDEDNASCPGDCPAYCGDGICSEGESHCTCSDCHDCGDGVCTFMEAYPPGSCSDCDGSPTWVALCPGTFMMGSPGGERGRGSDEPRHEVTLTRGFVIRSTEVTRDEFAATLGYAPTMFGGCGSCPVDQASWREAAAYCNALSDAEGLARCYDCSGSGWGVYCAPSAAYASPYDCPGYRLPTEAEWEYAARAGDSRATYNGEIDSDLCSSAVLAPIAWYCGTSPWDGSRGMPQPVGLLAPNDWGLFDMLGNAQEWCHDIYLSDYGTGTAAVVDPVVPEGTTSDGPWPTGRARRGAYADSYGSYVRAAERTTYRPDWGSFEPHYHGYTFQGFRPVRTLDP